MFNISIQMTWPWAFKLEISDNQYNCHDHGMSYWKCPLINTDVMIMEFHTENTLWSIQLSWSWNFILKMTIDQFKCHDHGISYWKCPLINTDVMIMEFHTEMTIDQCRWNDQRSPWPESMWSTGDEAIIGESGKSWFSWS